MGFETNKHDVRFTQSALVGMVAKVTSFNKVEVKECIDAIAEVIQRITLHPDCPPSFEFKLGSLGKIKLKARKGRPNPFKVKTNKDESLSTQTLCLKVFPQHRLNLATASRERAKCQEWGRMEVVGTDINGKPIKELKNYIGWQAIQGKCEPLDTKEV